MDGWNKDELYRLTTALEEAQALSYEINNCVRGCYSGARTYEELKAYVEKLANKFQEAADDIDGAWLDSHDEDEDDE